jgi:hypothetical protein
LPATRPGIEWGAAVAAKYLDDRASDGAGDPDDTFKNFTSTKFKVYEHAPDPFTPDHPVLYAPQWGGVKPWFFSKIQKAATPLPDPTSLPYKQDFENTKNLGRVDSTVRTQDQFNIGVFWAYDGSFSIGTPPLLFQQAVDAIVKELRRTDRNKVNSGIKLLRLYAITSGAMADACIAAWYEKYKWNYWRPVNGIRFRRSVKGTIPDPEWKPFGVPLTATFSRNAKKPVQDRIAPSFRTPMFPAYPSGHAAMGTATLKAAARALQLPETFRFSLTSDELNGKTKDQSGMKRPKLPRSFSIKGAIEENLLSRVYLGLHWFIDIDFGAELGTEIGEKIAASFPNKNC